MIKDILYKIETARDGNPTLVAEINGRNIPLHSRISPVKEGGASVYNLDPGKYDFLIILGCGLGYAYIGLKEIFEKYRFILIVEFLKDIKTEIEKVSHTRFLCDSKKIRFFSALETEHLRGKISEMIDFQEIKGIQVIEHPQSMRIFPEYYNEVKSIIQKILDKKASDKATIKAFGNVFLRNALNNLNNLSICSPVSVLAGMFSGKKAIIVSSAPSLEDNIEKLKLHEQSVYIIAVDSVLPVLHCYGIEPDFVVSIDPQPRIGEHFLGHEPGSSMHIFSIVSPPQLVSKYKGFISGNSHPVSQLINELYPDRGISIDSATGSVAGDAFNFAVLAGFEYIAMTGFDFSFSGNIIYARETAYQKRYSLYFSNRFSTAETFNARYIFMSSGSLVVEGKYTRRSFTGYRDSLDHLIREKNRGKVFMINERGLPLINAVSIDFDSFIKLPVSVTDAKSDYLQKIKSRNVPFVYDMKKVKDALFDQKIFTEIIRESVGDNYPERKKSKIRSMVSN